MKDSTILLLGGLGIGGFLLYNSGIFKVANSTSNLLSSGENATANAINTLSQDFLSVNKAVMDIPNQIGTTLSSAISSLKSLVTPDNSPKVSLTLPETPADLLNPVIIPTPAVTSIPSGGGGGGGTISSQTNKITPVTGGYVVQTPQGGVSYAGTPSLSSQINSYFGSKF